LLGADGHQQPESICTNIICHCANTIGDSELDAREDVDYCESIISEQDAREDVTDCAKIISELDAREEVDNYAGIICEPDARESTQGCANIRNELDAREDVKIENKKLHIPQRMSHVPYVISRNMNPYSIAQIPLWI